MRPRIWMLVLLVGCWSAAARGEVRQYTVELTSAGEDRSACSAAATKNAQYLVDELGRLNVGVGGAVFRQDFLLTVPVVEQCTARETGEGGAEIAIRPMAPLGGQAPALPAGRARMAVLYAGRGTLAELKGHEVAGRLVALEMTSAATGWRTCAGLGAAAILFLDSSASPAGNADFLNKTTTIPLGVPRFYCDDAAAVARIRAGQVKEMELHVKVTWQEKTAENVLWLIPGKPGLTAGGNANWIDQMVVLQARYDGASEVLGKAPGATQALNAAMLLDVAAEASKAREHRSVLVALTAGDEWNNRGTKALLDLLQREVRDAGRATAALGDRWSDARQTRAQAEEVVSGLQAMASVAGGEIPAAASAAIDQELLRQAARVETELQRARVAGDEAAATRHKADKLELLAAIDAVERGAGGVTAGVKVRITEAARRGLAVWEAEVERRRAAADALESWPTIRAAIGAREPLMFLSLALSGSADSDRYGLFWRSAYHPSRDVTPRMTPFAQAFRRYAAAWGGEAFDATSMENRFTLETFFPVRVGFSSDAAINGGIAAGALATVQDRAEFLATPHDLPEHIHWGHVAALERSISGLLVGRAGAGIVTVGGALTDPQFYGRADLAVETADQRVTLFEHAAGETLPRLTAAGALLGGEAEISGRPLGEPLAGTHRMDWRLTHADGTAVFAGAPRVGGARVRMQGFVFDAGGRPVRTLAGNQSETRGLSCDFYADPERPVRAMLFDCRRLDALGLFDPRHLDYLDQVQVLDARRGDAAAWSNVYARADAGLAAVFLEPAEDVRWQMLAARGNIGNRMVLINADAGAPWGRGFETADAAEVGPLNWRAARDFLALDTRRKADLERFGISNEVIRSLQAESERRFAMARAAEERHDYPAFFDAADAAWSLQAGEYQNLIGTSNGIIRGVIFLLLGVIPFSYFLERLLIGAVSIYRQIGWFFGIFAAMTAGLWFHPAFRISAAPLMILLAFMILILSTVVVMLLWGKFDEELAKLRGTGGAALHMASFRRGAVLGAAVRLGLSNMRRRGVRTALTLATLVLLTFTLLCFTSVREAVEITPSAVTWDSGAPLPPAGILIRQIGWRKLPAETVELARGLVLSTDAADKPGVVAQRWWYASERPEQSWSLPVRSTKTGPPGGAETYFVAGLIGLDSAEAEFQDSGAMSALPGLEHGVAGSCWLPDKARESLRVAAGDVVDILGYRLTVAGFFDAASFGGLRQLTGDPIAPLDPAGGRVAPPTAGGDPTDRLPVEDVYRYLDPYAVAIVPASLLQRLGGRLTSVMIRPGHVAARPDAGGAAAMNALAETVARRLAIPVFVSDGGEVRTINAALRTRPRDLGDVMVPLLIAGAIVLNTMLSAVSERTREIHVYTSVGLSPAHVGMLFLAEAAALGTLGVVFGYIFGQGTATVLSWTRIMPGVDLNYSSLGAILVMSIVLGLVMVSALWPAWSASRLASPSLTRDWKLPAPVGDVLAVDLPFTVNEAAARGVCAFIAEFLLTTSQAGTGRFTADDIHGFAEAQTLGMLRGISARVWLAPYDQGVSQQMRLSIHPTEQAQVFDVHVELNREAGNPAAWRRLNRPFLVEIRKQFLLWRALSAERVREYVERSEALFGEAGGKP